MTLKTVIELLRNEAECVKSADACDRDCGKCSLVKPTKDILEMYETAINVLEKLSCKNCIYLGHAFDIERLSSAQRDHIAEVSKKVDSDLISRQGAIDAIGKKSDEIYKTKQKGATYPHDDFFQGMAYAESVVKELPSAQPEIIRCKDCKYQEKYFHEDRRRKDGGYYIYGCELAEGYSHVCLDDDFCSRAERREE